MFNELLDSIHQSGQILESHKRKILEIRGKRQVLYSLQEAICLIASHMLHINELEGLNSIKEKDLTKMYITILIKIRSELKRPKSSFKIAFETLGEIDSDEFLNDIDKYDYKKISFLSEWNLLMTHMSLYFIQYRHLNKLARDLNLVERDLSISNKKEQRGGSGNLNNTYK